MKIPSIELPKIKESEKTPLVLDLLQIIMQQQKVIEQLEDEIKALKNHPEKPIIRPSVMDKNANSTPSTDSKAPKKNRPRRKKNTEIEIAQTVKVKPQQIPSGSIFKGYQEYIVQDIIIQPNNTRYLLERWQTPDGTYIIAEVEEPIKGKHFGPTLVSFIIHQYYHQHVTQPLLLEQLRELGIDISAGQLHRILTEDQEQFHQEKEAILQAGCEVSDYLQTDDTGARHQGKNGYCTYIGNELFAWFESTASKSRVNFLELLNSTNQDYMVNAGALEYMQRQGLPKAIIASLETYGKCFETREQWETHLKTIGVTGERHIKIATEGALMGSLLSHGFSATMGIVSDDAGQFNVFEHALCWIHAERGINKLIPLDNSQRKAISWARQQIWDLYASLKAYKENPQDDQKVEIKARFEETCNTTTKFETLNQTLKRLQKNRSELLLVLERPELPLHNNLSERDIRDYVKKRKISGGTRSDDGRRCRDTFASLKKTCRKHKISFWEYLKDRVARVNALLPLPDVIRRAAATATKE